MKFLKYLQEEWFGLSKHDNKEFNVFIDPNVNDFREVASKDKYRDFRFLINTKNELKLYVFNSDTLHDYVIDYLIERGLIKEEDPLRQIIIRGDGAIDEKSRKPFITGFYDSLKLLLKYKNFLGKYFANIDEFITNWKD